MVLTAIIVAVIAFGTGMAIGTVISFEPPIGDLRVDRSDPTSAPCLFLELDTDVHTVMCKRYATFRVKVKDFLPRK